MKREEGVLDVVLVGGTEIRLHKFTRDGGIVRRIPWHKDRQTGDWYSGVEGPEIKLETLTQLLPEDF